MNFVGNIFRIFSPDASILNPVPSKISVSCISSSVLRVWRDRAERVEGLALDCGHFLPEEAPEAVCEEFFRFFAAT